MYHLCTKNVYHRLHEVSILPSWVQQATELRENTGKSGRNSRIRTYDLCLPKAALYQAELYSEGCRAVFICAQQRRWMILSRVGFFKL